MDLLAYSLREIFFPFIAIITAIIGIAIAILQYKHQRVSLTISSRSETAVEALIKQLQDKDADVRKAAATALGTIKAVPVDKELQRPLSYDPTKFDDYHNQSLSHSNISFWFSLIFASLGFLIIGTSIFLYDKNASYPGIVAGTIVDAVAALFFQQSNKARKLMSDFFDKLRADRKLDESLRLCDSIDDPFMRNSLRVKLSLLFSGLEDTHNIAKEIITISKDVQMPLEKDKDGNDIENEIP